MTAPAAQPASEVGIAGEIAGRRRAQLLERGAQAGQAAVAAAAPGLSIADVHQLRSNASAAARVALAAKFGRQYDSLIAGKTRSLADSVLQLLVKDLEKNVRQSLAETLAASPNLPHDVAMRMAHDDIEIARPVLERSPVLSDEELVEIVRTHAMQYALAVAGREHLSEFLSDNLVATGAAEVVTRLVGNAGAKISAATLTRMAEDYRTDEAVQERLVRRPVLPYELVDQMVGAIGDRLGWELVRQRRMSADDARRLMAATRERATINIVAREHSERSVEREVRDRLVGGDLEPEDLLAFVRDGEISRFEAGMALLAHAAPQHTRRLLYGGDRRGLAGLCARAGFSTPHYVALRMTLDLAERGLKEAARDQPYADATMQFVQYQYEEIKADPALIGQWFDS